MIYIAKNEKFARLKLIRRKNISNATFWGLIKTYGSAENASQYLDDIFPNKYKPCADDIINNEINYMKNTGARFVFFDDELYPPQLRYIENPPPVLAFLGNKEQTKNLLNQQTLSVVGSRNATFNGMRFCFGICEEISKNNVTIISGLARGIDTSAHKGSLSHGTIAVLAGGINYIYPPENKKLYSKIIEQGGIFTEMPYNTYPTAGLFPRRNRIIAGVSIGTLVIEAAEKSGSLITAELAKKFNRIIFAVPNSPLDARSQGTNRLIKEGATVVTYASDVLNKLLKQNLFSEKEVDTSLFDYKIKASSVNDVKLSILKLIDSYSLKIDDIFNCIDANPGYIMQAITELELADKIQQVRGGSVIYKGD